MPDQEKEAGLIRRFVDAAELAEEWGISKAYAYVIIRSLNEKLLQEHPGTIIIKGKVNRKYYEEACDVGAILHK